MITLLFYIHGPFNFCLFANYTISKQKSPEPNRSRAFKGCYDLLSETAIQNKLIALNKSLVTLFS